MSSLSASAAPSRPVSHAAAPHDATDAALFDALYRAQGGRIYGYLRFRLGDDALAEDLTAEAFVRAWTRRSQFRAPDDAIPWLFAVARNLAVDHLRRRHRGIPLEAVPVELHPVATSPEEGLLSRERLATLERCLADLGEREREVLGLRFVAGLRNGEIATVIGTSEGNVAKIVHRTLRALRERLGEEGDGDDRPV